MHKVVNQLLAMEFTPAYGVTGADLFFAGQLKEQMPESIIESMLTVKALPSYIPPMIPMHPKWLDMVALRVRHSFQHLIADVWTQLLVAKMDAKERPLYIFWDKQVPVPNPATALAWLLMCEVWPMPTHREFDSNTPLRKIFPHQPFLLPQGSLYGFSGFKPASFARGNFFDPATASATQNSLTSLFTRVLNRTDRENMAMVAEHHPIHRPNRSTVTGYGLHMTPGYEREYMLMQAWPRRTNIRADYGYGAHEVWESEYSHNDLLRLRRSVMASLMNGPGLPTHKDNLHNPVGGHIRFLSEEGLHIQGEHRKLPWTSDAESIKIEHGLVIKDVPLSLPRTWFGFTKTGDDNDETHGLSAAALWASHYTNCRHLAIEQLMNPGETTGDIEGQAIERRTQLLKKAGRIKTKANSATHFAAAFKKALDANTVPESNEGDK